MIDIPSSIAAPSLLGQVKAPFLSCLACEHLSLHACLCSCSKMEEIIQAARKSWPLVRVAMAHRVGVVPVGEASVAIAASSVHRKESLAAVAFLIDEVKAKVPVWKKEFYAAEGTSKVAGDGSHTAEICTRHEQDGAPHTCHGNKHAVAREEDPSSLLTTGHAASSVPEEQETTKDEVGVWKRNAEWTLS